MLQRSVVLLALAGCSITPSAADAPRGTTYSCDGIPAAATPASRDPIAAQTVATWRALASERDRGTLWRMRVAHAVAHVEVPRGTADRVRVQHEILRVAQELAYAGDAVELAPAYLENLVMQQVRAVAPTAAELAALGASHHPSVDGVLGGELTDRATRSCVAGQLVHVSAFRGLLAFRPLRAGSTRALVAELVAFDTDGAPHITPLVDGMELRLGDDAAAPACVVHADSDGTLRPVPHDEIEDRPPFVTREGTGVGCKHCHHDANTMGARDLLVDEVAKIDRGRDAQVHELALQTWTMLAAKAGHPGR